MADSAYRESTADQLPELSKRSATLHAFTRDISVGGMSLVARSLSPRIALSRSSFTSRASPFP